MRQAHPVFKIYIAALVGITAATMTLALFGQTARASIIGYGGSTVLTLAMVTYIALLDPMNRFAADRPIRRLTRLFFFDRGTR